MKNRLTHSQRTQLLSFLDNHEQLLAPYTADGKARIAEKDLGFTITAGNVSGAMRLLSGADDAIIDSTLITDHKPLLPRQAEVIDQAAQYNEISATHKHGKVRPHLLDSFQREVELLERVRRLEVMMCKLCNHFGLEKPSAHAATSGAITVGVGAVPSKTSGANTGIFGKLFGGNGRIPE